MEKEKIIPINIWDDFYDDGFVPEGEKLKTYIYVEDDEISLGERKCYLEILLKYIKGNLNTKNIEMWLSLFEGKKKYPNLVGTEHENMLFDRWEIRLEGLTHERLHEWMVVLKDVDLKANNIPFLIYSES
jgi:hypothetical protein